ncbi:hypothetical protein ABPG74_009563 [Tetrahymena malaccensis]
MDKIQQSFDPDYQWIYDPVLILLEHTIIAQKYLFEYNKKKLFQKLESPNNMRYDYCQNLMKLISSQDFQFYNIFSNQKEMIIFFESVKQNHIQNCNFAGCFCQQFDCGRNAYENLIEFDLIFQFFYENANQILFKNFNRLQIVNQNNKNISFQEKQYFLTYVCFIQEIQNLPIKAYFLLMNVKSFLLKGINMLSLDIFLQLLEERIINQYKLLRTRDNNNRTQFNLMNILQFEDSLEDCKNKLQTLLLDIAQFYQDMCEDNILIEQIKSNTKKLLVQRKQLVRLFKHLYSINQQSDQLKQLASIYNQNIDCEGRCIDTFMYKYSKESSQRFVRNRAIFSQKKQNVFNLTSPDLCVIFTSFKSNNFIIQKTTKNFNDIFSESNKSVIGKQVNTLIPQFMQRSHSMSIDQYITRGQLTDIGIYALIQKDKQKQNLIIISQSGTIIELTENIFNKKKQKEKIYSSIFLISSMCLIKESLINHLKRDNQQLYLKNSSENQSTLNFEFISSLKCFSSLQTIYEEKQEFIMQEANQKIPQIQDINQINTEKQEFHVIKYQQKELCSIINNHEQKKDKVSEKIKSIKAQGNNQDKTISGEQKKNFDCSKNINPALTLTYRRHRNTTQSNQESLIFTKKEQFKSQRNICKQIALHLKQKSNPKILQIMLLAGTISIISFLAITLILSKSGMERLDSYYHNQKDIGRAMKISVNLFLILKTQSLYFDAKNTSKIKFSCFWEKGRAQNCNQLNTTYLFEQFKSNYHKLISTSRFSNKITDYLVSNEQKINFSSHYEDFDGNKSKQSVQPESYKLQQVLGIFFQDFQQFLNGKSYLFSNLQFITNLSKVNKILKNIDKYTQNISIQEFMEILETQHQAIIFNVVTCLCMLFIIIFIHTAIQIKKQNIYKLHGCFKPQHLQKQINKIQSCLAALNQKDSFETRKNLPQINIAKQKKILNYQESKVDSRQSKNNSKRLRQIPFFIGLKLFNLKFMIIVVLLLSLLMIQPVIIYRQTQSFVEEQNNILEEKNQILTLIHYIQYVHLKIVYFYNIFQFQDNINLTLVNLASFQQTIEKIHVILRNLNDKSVYSNNRFNQILYNRFYKSILSKDVCNVRKQFSEFYETNFPHYCDNLAVQRELQRGLIVFSNSLINELQMNGQYIHHKIQYLNQNNIFTLQKKYLEFILNKHNLMNQDYKINILLDLIYSILNYQIFATNEYFYKQNTVYFILLIIQLLLVIILFSIGWKTQLKQAQESLFKAKKSFYLYPAHLLSKNCFIISYLKKK